MGPWRNKQRYSQRDREKVGWDGPGQKLWERTKQAGWTQSSDWRTSLARQPAVTMWGLPYLWKGKWASSRLKQRGLLLSLWLSLHHPTVVLKAPESGLSTTAHLNCQAFISAHLIGAFLSLFYNFCTLMGTVTHCLKALPTITVLCWSPKWTHLWETRMTAKQPHEACNHWVLLCQLNR